MNIQAILIYCAIILALLVLVILTIFFILYINQSWIFSPTYLSPVCRQIGYFNNPSVAIANNYKASDILSIRNGQMFYTRPPRENCSPDSRQTVHIRYPQFCKFTDTDGNVTEWKDLFFEANVYTHPSIEGIVRTDQDCKPLGTTYVSGTIENKWV